MNEYMESCDQVHVWIGNSNAEWLIVCAKKYLEGGAMNFCLSFCLPLLISTIA